ncbi:MAG TPA: cyclase family protein [Pyrinomonadaceae bacterium]|jgi:arylformamidase|nr:cyclase family protein [Pyrinomonadaceae bacterium]
MKIYDVTVPISSETPIYQGDPPAKIDLCKSIAKGDAANVSQICVGVHTASHVDAPNHFIEGGARVHEIPLESLVGNCRVLELSDEVMAIEPEHLGDLANVERILFKTRNSAFWNTPEDGFRTDFTYISPGAARVLAGCGLKLVGIDYLSVEKFGSEDFATHITLLEKNIVIVEGLDLRQVPAGDYEITCLPLKYIGGGGDGSPARTILRTVNSE